MDCERIRDLMVLVLFDEAEPEQRVLVGGHVERCEACRDYYAELRAAAALLERMPRFEPPRRRRRRLRPRLARATRAAAAAAVVLVAALLFLGRGPVAPPLRTAPSKAELSVARAEARIAAAERRVAKLWPRRSESRLSDGIGSLERSVSELKSEMLAFWR